MHSVLWDPAAVCREAKAHLARLQAIAGDADRVVDKLPDNIMAVGHIAVLFPRARVNICRRDLRDVAATASHQTDGSSHPPPK